MPLSEEELRLLEQMERALVAEDPKLASTMRGTRVHRHARRQMIGGALGFVAGIGLLMTGAITKVVPIGILGFVVMLLCAYLALAAWRGGQAAAADPTATPPAGGGDESGLRMIEGGKRPRRSRQPKAKAARGSMMERFEERWRRRREQGGYGRDY